MLEQVFLMDLDVHGADGSITDRLVAAGALSQSKVNGLPGALSALDVAIQAELARAQAAEAALDAAKFDKAGGAIDADGVVSLSNSDAATSVSGSEIAIVADHTGYDDVATISATQNLEGFSYTYVEDGNGINKDFALGVDGLKIHGQNGGIDYGHVDISYDLFGSQIRKPQSNKKSWLVQNYDGFSLQVGTNAQFQKELQFRNDSGLTLQNAISGTPLMPTSDASLVVKQYVDEQVATATTSASDEAARALAAEAELDGRLDILEGPNTQVGSVAYAVKAEETRALAAEAVIAGDLAAEIARAQAEELDIRSDFAAGDAATLSSAESYTDTAIANLVNSAPALLDTLGEIATALEAEQSATASILTAISNEVTRATAAENLLDGRLDVIEAKQWHQALLLTNSQGVTSLAKPVGAPAIPNNSAEVQVFIDGRKVFLGSQFSVAAGGGAITFPALKQNQTVELLYWA